MTITKVNVYRNAGEWCYAAWAGDEFDHSDTLGIDGDAAEALAAAALQFDGASIHRVADTEEV